MIEVIGGVYVFGCDDCGRTLDTNERNRREAVNVLKANKWRFHNHTEHGKFIHYCVACKRKP